MKVNGSPAVTLTKAGQKKRKAEGEVIPVFELKMLNIHCRFSEMSKY